MSFMVALGLLILRRRAANLDRPFKVWLPIAFLFLAAQAFLIVTPFIRPASGKGDTSLPYWLAPLVSVIFLFGGVIVWFVWRVAIPLLGGFEWVTQEQVLQDGTVVLTWKKSKGLVGRIH
jgi:amino acid transporter